MVPPCVYSGICVSADIFNRFWKLYRFKWDIRAFEVSIMTQIKELHGFGPNISIGLDQTRA